MGRGVGGDVQTKKVNARENEVKKIHARQLILKNIHAIAQKKFIQGI